MPPHSGQNTSPGKRHLTTGGALPLECDSQSHINTRGQAPSRELDNEVPSLFWREVTRTRSSAGRLAG
jgi:hypothetical protein